MIETTLGNISVWSVSCIGVAKSASAFTTLESKLPTLTGRKFYGCLIGNPYDGIYRACVAKIDSDKLNLESWVIPCGKYLKTKIKNWSGSEYLIGQTFSVMSKNISVDISRPSIEFYRSQQEIILYLPIY